MLEYLKFSIGGFFSGYKTIKLWCKENAATYEVVRTGLMEEMEPGTREPIDNTDWLTEWDNLNVNEWDNEYVDSDVCDGTQWELDFREYGKTRRRIYGSNAYPVQWYRFLEWLDLLMPDMQFIAPDRLDVISFLYHGMGINGIEEEHLFINRTERTVTLKKGTIFEGNGQDHPYVKSSHSYDFSDDEKSIMQIMDECQSYFMDNATLDTEQDNEKSPKVAIELTYHNGTKKNLLLSSEQCDSEDWHNLMGCIKNYISDVYSVLLHMSEILPSKQGKYIYCKVRFGKSSKLYSYRTNDSTLEVGDVVKVPAGKDGDIGYATIEEIGYFTKEDAPYQVEKTKLIIGLHYKREKMNLNTLRSILEKENVWKYDYSLSEKEPPMCEVTSCIREKANGFEFYISERNEKREIQFFENENDVCQAFLVNMSLDHPALKKYIKTM